MFEDEARSLFDSKKKYPNIARKGDIVALPNINFKEVYFLTKAFAPETSV